MRNLESTEICNVSGGDFWTNDGCFIGVPSKGIPIDYYNIIDTGVKMMFNGASDNAIDSYFSKNYVPSVYFDKYIENFANATIYCNF